jgi:hypothetical protein
MMEELAFEAEGRFELPRAAAFELFYGRAVDQEDDPRPRAREREQTIQKLVRRRRADIDREGLTLFPRLGNTRICPDDQVAA